MLPWSSEDAVRRVEGQAGGTSAASAQGAGLRALSGLCLPEQHYDGAAQLNLAPIFDTAATGQSQPGVALLGEIGKVTAVSTFRFAAVGLGSTGGSLEVELRGSPDELVTLLFAREATTAPGTAASASSQDFDCIFVNATIAANSTAFVSLSLVA